MAKTITISEEAYKLLLSEKREGESFSDVIIRLVKNGKKRNIMDYAGIWANMSDEEVDKLFKDLDKMWKKWNADV
ncbi:antitoxin [Sulfolobus sp. S-194]|uniref:antitoxin VapB family protein n=1 Tax=Sulfolobus sp. S-194 TaxID=2512240 RepID=UPI001436CCF4|nr:antitoxin VapB family protein [Sulfolobus sp. S-194]QIW23782.1 antitoxin [Sulfolobus sp. S-194]